MNPKEISIKDFTYELPADRIAKFPLSLRDESKLLVFEQGMIKDFVFKELPYLLDKNSLMVFNNTKVIHARLNFQKESGSAIEVFCLEPISMSFQQAFESTQTCVWHCLLGHAKKWKGEILKKSVKINNREILIEAELLERDGQYGKVKLSWPQLDISFGELLFEAGVLPLPPYLNREAELKDEMAYQTTYAKLEGSVAAPTAGLHFTETVLNNLINHNISKTELTLHVGAGTFMPVKSDTMKGHNMHREFIQIKINTLKEIANTLTLNKKIISVGTTSMRTLESIYWHGIKLILNPTISLSMDVLQWDPYETETDFTALQSVQAVIDRMELENQTELLGSTQILISPGYKFRIVDGLVTNFHQPNSTLLLLVSAFIGESWRDVYKHALAYDYRFLSFGDSSLLWRP
jgi:S-adenosylmethionine:tRNA ribosyltransferase-isomerase